MNIISPNQISPYEHPINENIPVNPPNSNTVNHVNVDVNSIPATPENSRKRFWSRIAIIIIILIWVLFITVAIVLLTIYLTRKTCNVDISFGVTTSTTSGKLSSKST
ncbi:unnamed protein product [Adineta steineri]|uniref:Uncharacterized protein n=3 Tax=Adineta steineri TaxID=433720 RepID=A0A819P215_9BILA|nr:unnamed protein product [Adineta steineri]